MKIKAVEEGGLSLLVPDPSFYGSIYNAPVFYNPEMAWDRELSLKVLKALIKKGKVLDLLAATGVRGLRYAREGYDVTCVDINPKACELIRRNADRNALDIEVWHGDARDFLRESVNEFDFIDIDPFGSPLPFLDALFPYVKRAFVAVTATDTGTLSGAFPEACLRRYGIVCKRTSFYKEVGLRNLIAYIVRAAAKYEKGVRIKGAYYRKHYYRVWFEVWSQRKWANRMIRQLGFIKWDDKTDERILKRESMENAIGITWIGHLGQRAFLENVEHPFAKELMLECDLPPYYSTHYLAKIYGRNVKPRDEIIKSLRDLGFRSERTHFEGPAFKTLAPLEDILRVVFK